VGTARHLLAIALLPGTVTIAVPALIALPGDAIDVGWGLPVPLAVVATIVGAALVVAGGVLWYRTVTLFARIGDGTLAPWDPPRRLVVAGPYRYVRNPMITGVTTVLVGEAALLGSPPLLAWAAVFLAINAAWFPLGEEPGLERRFGDEYRDYARNVPRWIPRLRPWEPERRGP
jgi:protein-S-isoprenylcysteine O-methyltransferase Ste14